MAYKRKRTYKRKRSYKRSYSTKKRRVSYSTKRYVKREVSRAIQNKKIQRALDGITYSSLIDNSAVYTLMPSMTQGSGEADRNANKIRIKKAILRATFTSFAGTAAAHYVDIYIFKNKNGITAPTLANMTRFLESANTATGYDGEPLDGLRPVNKYLFTPKMHVRRRLASTTSGTSGTAIASLPPTFNMVKDITKYFKKDWVYDDNTNAVSNENVFIAVGGSNMGSQVIQNFGNYSFCVDFEYEDA